MSAHGGPESSTGDRRIDLILEQVDSLPTLSPIAARLLQVASADDSDLQEIVRLIESDPAMTSRILSICRKAGTGMPASVNTVHKAVVMLGLETVQAVTLSISVYEVLEAAAADREDERVEIDSSSAFDRRGFWKHSVGVACAAELLAQQFPRLGVAGEEAFVAGLLHGIGKIVLDLVLPRAYANVVRASEERQVNGAAMERSIIGIDHHTAGKRLGTRWGLPASLTDVMWLHSQPGGARPRSENADLITLVSLGKLLCRHLHIGFSGDFEPPQAIEEAAKRYGIDPMKVELIVPKLHEQVAERVAVLGIDHETSAETMLQSVLAANRRLGRMYRALQRRTRRAADAEGGLAQTVAFLKDAMGEHDLTAVLGETVRSAAGAMGPGYYAVLLQRSPLGPWRICSFSESGRLQHADEIEPPAGWFEGIAALRDPDQLSMAAIGILPWLSDFVSDAVDIRRVKLVPLAWRERGGATAILMHDREPLRDIGRPLRMDALIAAWSCAITSAAHAEESRRSVEQMGEVNRELAEMQAKLSRQESLARLGEMAAGAAHEMNNPLAVISGRSQLIAGTIENESIRADAAAIADAARDLSDLITGLKVLASPPPMHRREASLRDAITRAIEEAAEQPGDVSRVEVQGDDIRARLDPDLLRVALAELIRNSLQSSPEARVTIASRLSSSGDLLITVRDTGPGMPQRTLQHAFDPFFSDKPAGRRTGLGLTRARRMIEIHSGSVSLDSSPGQGAIAIISIPDCASAATDAPDRTIKGEAA